MEKSYFASKGVAIAIISTTIVFFVIAWLNPLNFGLVPQKGTFEAKVLCGELFKPFENKISSEYVKKWVVPSILNKFEEEAKFLSDRNEKQLRKDSKIYLQQIKSGVVSDDALIHIGILVKNAKAKSQ